MNNKVLIKLLVPCINETYDIFIPVNEMVWKVTKLIVKSISDLSNNSINYNDEFILINLETGRIYNNNEIIIDTDIKNSQELVLLQLE